MDLYPFPNLSPLEDGGPFSDVAYQNYKVI